jgi:hypothetical protein
MIARWEPKVKIGDPSMATNNPNSVEQAEAILADLKDRAQKAHDAEDVFLMGVLTELIGVCSPIVTKAIARQHRESRARINADHKALRAKARESKGAERN